jgi:NAD(P)H-dependent flavin oxidoreductase YrpB (nitropropane dioxygenase family)
MGSIAQSWWEEGNYERGMFPVGQVVGRIHDILSVKELIERIFEEALAIKNRIAAL